MVDVLQKEVYGLFVAQLALQYVVCRTVLSGVLIELQKRLSAAINTSGSVPFSLIVYTICLLVLASIILVVLSLSEIISVPTLGLLMALSMITSIAALATKTWAWYRASIIVPEVFLLSLLLLWRGELDFATLYFIYHLYYGIQALLGAIGAFLARNRFQVTRSEKTALGDVVGGGVATLSLMGRDRLAIVVAASLYPAGMVAELAYLLTVVKGVLSIGGTLNSVKFVHLSGVQSTIVTGKLALIIENVAVGAIALCGYIFLKIYTIYFGNVDYADAVSPESILVMTLACILIFNHSIWYSNQVLRSQIWTFNFAALIFFAAFAAFFGILAVVPILNAQLFYFGTQLLLVGSVIVMRVHIASQNY